MFDAQVNQIRDSLAEFALDRLRATGEAFWDALTDTQKDRIAQTVRDLPTLGFESILSGENSLGGDMRAALWTVGTDVSTAMLKAMGRVDDPVVRAIFELVLSTLRDRKEGPEDA